jgi:hypothetical protein
MMPGFSVPGYPLREFVQQDGDMPCLPSRAMGDLVTATGAVGHDNGAGIFAHRR